MVRHHSLRDDSRVAWAYVARCGGLLAISETAGLLLVGATDCSATAHKLKTSSISSSVQSASTLCEYFQDGQ